MKNYIGCDSHQRHSVLFSMDEKGEAVPGVVEHAGNELRKFLGTLPRDTGAGDFRVLRHEREGAAGS